MANNILLEEKNLHLQQPCIIGYILLKFKVLEFYFYISFGVK